jgi:hypothetical protein
MQEPTGGIEPSSFSLWGASMQTKVRIVGEQSLGKKIAKVIEEHFEIKKREKFGTTPYRYIASMPLGCSIYITVKKEKKPRSPNPDSANPDSAP